MPACARIEQFARRYRTCNAQNERAPPPNQLLLADSVGARLTVPLLRLDRHVCNGFGAAHEYRHGQGILKHEMEPAIFIRAAIQADPLLFPGAAANVVRDRRKTNIDAAKKALEEALAL